MAKPRRILRSRRWNPEIWKAIERAAKAEGIGVSALLEKAFCIYYPEVAKMSKAEREKLDAKARSFFEGRDKDSKE